jgi:large subunit ribosomal protein L10
MPTPKKAETIEKLALAFSKTPGAVIADFRGLRASEMTVLRKRLKDAGVTLVVVKDTLARIAATKAGKEALTKAFIGPIAIAFSSGDVVQPAKSLLDYVRTNRDTKLAIKGGFLGDRLISVAEVTTLATLPSREALIARLMGSIQAPIARLVGQLQAPLSGFARTLDARRKQLEEAATKSPQAPTAPVSPATSETPAAGGATAPATA